jgi:hypothetical protein
MWMYPVLSSLDHPFSIELDDMEINAWTRGVLAQGKGSSALGEFVRILVRLPVMISVSYHMRVPAQGLWCARSALLRVTLPVDVVRWEANCIYNEQLWAQGKGDRTRTPSGR